MKTNLPVIAGVISSTIFMVSMIPMLLKARWTKDLESYSLTSLVLTAVGNLIHSVYVYSLPAGPIWFLHAFYLITTVLMLAWYVRYEVRLHRCTTTKPDLTEAKRLSTETHNERRKFHVGCSSDLKHWRRAG